MINWGALQQGGGFQNALATGLQLGQMARQRQDEREYRNALSTVLTPRQSGQTAPQAPAMVGGSGIVATPEQQAETARMEAMFPNAPKYAPEDERAAAMRVIAQRNPQLFAQMQAQEAARAAAAREQRMEQLGTFRRLLNAAGTNPQQAFAAAQQMGIDTSAIPQPGTPEFEPWRQQQLFILNALEKEGDNLPGLAQEVMLALPEDQRDPNSPAFRQAFTAALENKYAAEYTDAQGNTRRRAIIGQPPQPQMPQLLPRTARPAGKTDDQLFAEARQAVEQGADVNVVFRQLREWGVEVN